MTMAIDNTSQPQLPRPGTPGARSPYTNSMPQSPGITSPGLPDYGALNDRALALKTQPYNRQDIRRAGGQAQTTGNATARAALARMAANGGNMGSGAAALVGGSLYGAAAMSGLDASRGMDLENRKSGIEGEERRAALMAQIAAMQQQATLSATSLNQNATNANRDFDYRIYADDRSMDLNERQQTLDQRERDRRATQDQWRFENEQRNYPMDPRNPYSPNSPMNPVSNYTPPGFNNSSNAAWAAQNPYRRF